MLVAYSRKRGGKEPVWVKGRGRERERREEGMIFSFFFQVCQFVLKMYSKSFKMIIYFWFCLLLLLLLYIYLRYWSVLVAQGLGIIRVGICLINDQEIANLNQVRAWNCMLNHYRIIPHSAVDISVQCTLLFLKPTYYLLYNFPLKFILWKKKSKNKLLFIGLDSRRLWGPLYTDTHATILCDSIL